MIDLIIFCLFKVSHSVIRHIYVFILFEIFLFSLLYVSNSTFTYTKLSCRVPLGMLFISLCYNFDFFFKSEFFSSSWYHFFEKLNLNVKIYHCFLHKIKFFGHTFRPNGNWKNNTKKKNPRLYLFIYRLTYPPSIKFLGPEGMDHQFKKIFS